MWQRQLHISLLVALRQCCNATSVLKNDSMTNCQYASLPLLICPLCEFIIFGPHNGNGSIGSGQNVTADIAVAYVQHRIIKALSKYSAIAAEEMHLC